MTASDDELPRVVLHEGHACGNASFADTWVISASRAATFVRFCNVRMRSCAETRQACAAGGARAHDLGVMRPTRCQLRYRRSWVAGTVATPAKKMLLPALSIAAPNVTAPAKLMGTRDGGEAEEWSCVCSWLALVLACEYLYGLGCLGMVAGRMVVCAW